MSCNELIVFLVRSSSESRGIWRHDQPNMKESNQQLVIVEEWQKIDWKRAVLFLKRVSPNKLFKRYKKTRVMSVITSANFAS